MLNTALIFLLRSDTFDLVDNVRSTFESVRTYLSYKAKVFYNANTN